MNSKFSY